MNGENNYPNATFLLLAVLHVDFQEAQRTNELFKCLRSVIVCSPARSIIILISFTVRWDYEYNFDFNHLAGSSSSILAMVPGEKECAVNNILTECSLWGTTSKYVLIPATSAGPVLSDYVWK